MEGTKELLAGMPLAEATFWLFRYIASDARLQEVFEKHRGRAYEKTITFSLFVRLIADALLQHDGSGRQSFVRAQEVGDLQASLTAVYGKLKRTPLPLSMGLLEELSSDLRDVFPAAAHRQPPPSLQGLRVLILDGKVIKHVQKRLKILRSSGGGLLGARTLVGLEYQTGLVLALQAEADGHANDVRFVADLLPRLREQVDGPRLWLADSAFCDLVRVAQFREQQDHYLLRYHPKCGFHADPERPARESVDDQGRRITECWGWLGRETLKQRPYVRTITLHLPEKEVTLVTDLLSSTEYPAADLLAMYLERWGIERVFQQVTEVFDLKHLIGSTPQATLFQFVFCLLLYDLIQVVRAYVGAAQTRDVETISIENLFVDVHRQLTAWSVLAERNLVSEEYFGSITRPRLRERLERLLRNEWSALWIKASDRKPRPRQKPPGRRGHNSVYRLLKAASTPKLKRC